MSKVIAAAFYSDRVIEVPNRALGMAMAIATALRPSRGGTTRLLDPASLPDRMKHDIGLPSGLFGTPERHWSDYR